MAICVGLEGNHRNSVIRKLHIAALELFAFILYFVSVENMEEGLRQVFKGELRGRHVETIRIEKHRVKIKEEADLLKLDHPNILRLVPCGNDNDYM